MQRALQPARVYGRLQRRSVGVLNVNPARANVPPRGSTGGAHVPRGYTGVRRLEPGLVRVSHAHPRVDALQAVHGGVHLGDEHRLVAGLLGSARH